MGLYLVLALVGVAVALLAFAGWRVDRHRRRAGLIGGVGGARKGSDLSVNEGINATQSFGQGMGGRSKL